VILSVCRDCVGARLITPCLKGIVSILFCGVIMAHYTYHNLSPPTQKFSSKLFKVVASLSEMFVFAYLGLALFSFDQKFDFSLIFFSVVQCGNPFLSMKNEKVSVGLCSLLFFLHKTFCLGARLLNILPICFLVNLFHRKSPKRQVPLKEQFVIWFSGISRASCCHDG